MPALTRRAIAGALAIVTGVALVGCAGDTSESAATVGDAPSVTFATTPTSDASDATPTEVPTDAPTAVEPGATDPGATATTVVGAEPAPTATTAPTAPTTSVDLGPPAIRLETVATAVEPTDVAWRAGDTTMFVVQQGGQIVPVRDGTVGKPVLDIDDRVDSGGERGLLGLTFSLDGALAYVDYTDNDGNTVIAEYPVDDDGSMDASQERVLMNIDQPYANHNGGNVMVGADGLLYIGMGDGGSGGDPERRALNVGQLLGKILRIDPAPADGNAYTIPPDNPFVGVDGAQPEIWSVGVRNPWRMSFDAPTGDLWFGDVGQGDWEEIDVARATDGAGRGVNFGWSAWEGMHRYNDDQSADGATPPVFEYQHGDAGCSVSGGAVYRGTAVPALAGWYVFGDYCSGIVTGLLVDGTTVVHSLELANLAAVGAVRVAPDGELWATSLNGDIARIIAA